MALVIDLFLAVLLISAIGYGMILNRRIVALRRDQANLERLANSFHEATKRAETSVEKLKKAAQSSSEILSEGIDTATQIREDLNFLIDRGDKLGDRLEGSVRSREETLTPNKNAKKPEKALNSPELRDGVQVKKNIDSLSPQPRGNVTSFDAEMLGNKIVKSEVERELIKALRAVR